MGGGSWTTQAYVNSLNTRGIYDSDSIMAMDTQEYYTSRNLDPILNPKNVVRECCDSEEHPNTIPVILALDVTGSMGNATKACAAKLNEIMTSLLAKYDDVQFMIMGIGDLAYDRAPIQASQFESDIRILEQLDKIYFEGGGGGNGYESYTAAWWFALNNTKLDCHKRGQKGIIITLGDEPLNPYLPASRIGDVLGRKPEKNIETKDLYPVVCEKFDVYHIAIDDPGESSYSFHRSEIERTWKPMLGERMMVGSSKQLPELITAIVDNVFMGRSASAVSYDENGAISW